MVNAVCWMILIKSATTQFVSNPVLSAEDWMNCCAIRKIKQIMTLRKAFKEAVISDAHVSSLQVRFLPSPLLSGVFIRIN